MKVYTIHPFGALSGDPVQVFSSKNKRLAYMDEQAKLDWDRVSQGWVDKRCGPIGSFKTARERILHYHSKGCGQTKELKTLELDGNKVYESCIVGTDCSKEYTKLMIKVRKLQWKF